MNFVKSNQEYEAWLKTTLEIVPADLKEKHTLMAQDVFSFLRATFFRWCQLFPEVCPEFDKAPQTLAVGDLHVENFGTWRDAEARLVWGINDFDEVATMPFSIDLVRLATSAHLAINAGHLGLEHKEACLAIAQGYKEGLLVTRRGCELDGRGADLIAQRAWQIGRRRFLDDLLIAPLDRAFALIEMDDIARAVAQHLHLDMARPFDQPSA